MGIDQTGHSPTVQRRILHAGVNASSYQQASRDLAVLSDLTVGPKPVERLVHRIGQERIEQRDAAVASHMQRPLMQQDTATGEDRPHPQVAMVSMDGGRLQIRSSATPESASTQSSHWRESKVGVLETYICPVLSIDPDPDVPRCFLDLKRTAEMVRGLGHTLPTGLEFVSPAKDTKLEGMEAGHEHKTRPGKPARLVRSVLASRACSDDFGPMLHQAAWERNFFGATRKVFLGDGLPVNWTIQQRHFPKFKPILDFVHALSYVFAAAFAGRVQAVGQEIYNRWIQAVWEGKIRTVLAELEERSKELGPPPDNCVESDPRNLVFEASRYLTNNAHRMDYAEYRRTGLPIMTSAVESVIKMINKRVKGSEKFWSEGGAEAILQLRADFLSETEAMEKFWVKRENQAGATRSYRKAS